MAKSFQVDVVSPEATVWSGEAAIVIARTTDGELGIMADHQPLMGSLATGAIEIESESGERTTIGVHGGFVQVLDNQVTFLTDRAEIAETAEEAHDLAQQLAEAAEDAPEEA